MVNTVDAFVTNTPPFKLEGKLRECEQCGTTYHNSVEWAKYCSKACKQVAYRSRKGIETPSFLKVIEAPDSVKTPTIIETPKVAPVATSAATLAYQEQAEAVRKITNEMAGLESRKAARQKALSVAENKDPHFAAHVTAALMSVVIMIVFLGAGYLFNRKYNKGKNREAYRVFLFAALAGLVLGSVINLVARGGAAKHNRSLDKTNRVKEIAEHIEELGEQIEQIRPNLDFAKQTLQNLKALLPEGMEAPTSKLIGGLLYTPTKESSASVLTASELRGKTFDLLTISEDYTRLFGQPERGFAMAVHGAPGQGKSTFVINLAYALAVDNGTGIYISAEEGFSQSMKTKIAGFETDALLVSNHRTLAGIEQGLKLAQYSVVVLDSIQQIGLNADQLRALREEYPRTSFIYILQVRKDGNFKGDNRFAHDADIEIKLDKFVPYRIKSRFA